MASRGRRGGVGLLILFALGLSGVLLAATSASAATKSISMKNIAYNPETVTIHVGDKVTWTNNETGLYAPQHTATSDDGHTFDSGYLNPGQSYSVTFIKAGTFAFHCNVHSNMHGTITVVGSTPTPTPTHRATPTPTPTHAKPKPTATAAAKPTVVPVSPTPTSSAKPSPRVSHRSAPPTPSSTPSRVVAEASSSSSQTGVTIGLIAGALVILVGGALFVVRKRRTIQ